MKMKLVRNNNTGREYAMPSTKYSGLPCFLIKDGLPEQTNFNFLELNYMIATGKAEVIGDLVLTLTPESQK